MDHHANALDALRVASAATTVPARRASLAVARAAFSDELLRRRAARDELRRIANATGATSDHHAARRADQGVSEVETAIYSVGVWQANDTAQIGGGPLAPEAP